MGDLGGLDARPDPGADGAIVDTGAALAEEFALIHGEDVSVGAGMPASAFEREQAALCLSGGGIRSAAFCLGVLQGLAERDLLERFHYLSTVSGGGFVGGWFSVLSRRVGLRRAQEAIVRLPTSPEMDRLREFTNYLTPRGGIFAVDTWTALLLLLRNLVLNWLVFLPWFLVAVILARLYRDLLWLCGEDRAVSHGLAAAAAATLFAGTVGICLGLPGHRRVGASSWRYLGSGQVAAFVLFPAFAWTALLPMTFSRYWREDFTNGREWALPLAYLVVTALAYAIAGLLDLRREASVRRADESAAPRTSPFRSNAVAWLIASGTAAAFLWLGLWLGRTRVPGPLQATALAVVGPLWFVLVDLLHAAVHVGLRPEAERADLDREWLARVSALKLRGALGWAAFAACCLLLADVLFTAQSWTWIYGALTAGPVGAWLGKQVLARAQAGPDKPTGLERAFAYVPPLLCAMFAAALFALLGHAVHLAVAWLHPPPDPFAELAGAPGTLPRDVPAPLLDLLGSRWPSPSFAESRDEPGRAEVLALVGAGMLLALVGAFAGARINVNRFSLNGVYRNRLMRAFLGSARLPSDRRQEPLTGFDQDDNVTLASLLPDEPGHERLFPVINTALNLSFSERLAWSERKAAPFTITPLRCGSAALPREGQGPGEAPDGRFVDAARYAGLDHPVGTKAFDRLLRLGAGGGGGPGIRLAGALAVSGAAVSPNWGYHSSRLTAFVMTLFNVRLGAWLPNPANLAVARDASLLGASMPGNSALALFSELVGRTDATSRALYLSDGGHFDNLGLYEMLRRRCRFVLAVDAGQDGQAVLRDLGEAVRKADVDLGVRITVDRRTIVPRADVGKVGTGAGATGFAVGEIRYPDHDVPGILVYLKASWLPDLPVEVRAYGERRADFPHEPTLDQWFTESQFESYRRLGRFQVERMLGAIAPRDLRSARGLFERLREQGRDGLGSGLAT